MRVLAYTCLVMALCLFQGCGQSNEYAQKIKTLDSLNGALNLKVKELEKTDTALLQRCILRFNYYRQFIKQGVNDTLVRNEADQLQRFYESGRNLEVFHANRFSILGRASLINSQQNKLAADLKNKAIEPKEAEPFITREKEAISALIDAANTQQKLFYTSVEEFRGSLHDVERLIRDRNNGQLPTIVRDTLSL